MITKTNFDTLSEMILERTAISLDHSKRYLIVDRLSPILNGNHLNSLDDLVIRLRRKPSDPLWDQVIDAVTTNETSFFRDAEIYSVLEKQIIPNLIQQAVQEDRLLHFWSAGCSTGQEAYSLAMIVHEIAKLKTDRVRIIGSDVSHDVVAKAKNGAFGKLEIRRGLTDARRDRFFSADSDRWTARDELKEMIQWQQFSLNQSWPPLPQFDLILMRNVLVYFNDDDKRTILSRAGDRMQDEGTLLLGGAEASPLPREIFTSIQYGSTTVYRKPIDR